MAPRDRERVVSSLVGRSPTEGAAPGGSSSAPPPPPGPSEARSAVQVCRADRGDAEALRREPSNFVGADSLFHSILPPPPPPRRPPPPPPPRVAYGPGGNRA
eukprot:6844914-Pyramimonas_sp.AAC.1